MKVLLIGCGETGGAIASNIIKIKKVKSLGLYSRTVKSSKALAFDLKSKKVKILENLRTIKRYDYIIITLSGISDSARKESFSKRTTSYQVRQDELKYNLGAITGLVPSFKKLNKKSRIIVVTNPVDEMVNYLRIILKNKNVFGFGLDLDCKRYANSLKKNIFCVGTHGKAIPLINNNSEKVYDSLYKKSDSSLMNYIKRNGLPAKVGGETFSKFFEKFTSSKKEIIHIASYLEEEFEGVKNISIALPRYVKNGKILGIADIKLNNIEKKRFQKSSRELNNSVKHIIATSKKLVSYK